jgi:hypothetical protein
MERTNTKALNLGKLHLEKNKITLGFKCSPRLKLKLAQEAHSLNITLSEYVESIAENHDSGKNHLLAQKIKEVEFYENDLLQTLFLQNKGKTFDFTTAKGESLKIHIETLQDVYTVLINSFKISK